MSVDEALIEGGVEDYGALVIGVAPREMWKDDPRRTGDTVHYYIHRPKNIDVEAYRAALPLGTRVVLFGSATIETLITGDSGGIVHALSPQGLYIADAYDKPVNVWAKDLTDSDWPGITTVAELRAAVA